MKNIGIGLYYLLIITPIIQNFFLGKYIGKIGNTPVPIVIVISLIYILFFKIKIKLYENNKILGKLLVYLVFINIMSMFVYLIIFNGDVMILGENIVIKSLKGLSYFIFIFVYIVVINTFIETVNMKQVFKPFVVGTIIVFLVLLMELRSPELFNQIFHSGTTYSRVRLLTSESSFTIAMIFIYPLVSLYYYLYIKKSLFKFLIISVIFAMFILTSGSKSVLINLPIAIIIILVTVAYRKITRRKSVNIIKLFCSIILGTLILIILLPKFEGLFLSLQNDLNQYTSIITRFYTIIVACFIMAKFPFGTGNALYLSILPKELGQHIDIISISSYNLTEIFSFIYAVDDKTLGVKSGVGQYAVYWGIIGTVVFFNYLFKIYKQITREEVTGRFVLMFLYLIIVIGIIDFITFDTDYEILAMFVLVQYISNYASVSSVKE